jgi:membrane fusion protein (multidrug efflux system)
MPLNAGQSAFPLVSTPDHYIEANIRETDLTYVREGDPARITVDAYPDSPIAGKVTTLAPASGSLFALLPQNATGNWLKVVQRIPVRLSIDTVPNGVALRAGMSVKISIDTGPALAARTVARHQRNFRSLRWPGWSTASG